MKFVPATTWSLFCLSCGITTCLAFQRRLYYLRGGVRARRRRNSLSPPEPAPQPETEHSTPTAGPEPEPVPAGGGGGGGGGGNVCEDSPSNWTDGYNDRCDWYEEFDFQGCPYYGAISGTQGKTAREACCWCGGGEDGGGGGGGGDGDSENDNNSCANSPDDWRDGYNDGCYWYEVYDMEGCPNFGTITGTDEKNANDACCWCGGGLSSDNRGNGTGGGHDDSDGSSAAPAPEPEPEPEQVPEPEPGVPSQAQTEKEQWLVAHNTRREVLHTSHGLVPRPLKWSTDLEQSARGYANQLMALPGCQLAHGVNGDSYGGENLWAAWGSGAFSTNPETVLVSWWDDEEEAMQGHFTQAAWYATEYLGCAGASKPIDSSYGSITCHVQVCRYLRPGNCNLNANDPMGSVLSESSPCEPACPRDGCF